MILMTGCEATMKVIGRVTKSWYPGTFLLYI